MPKLMLCDDCGFATEEHRALVNHTLIYHLKRQFLVCPFSPDRKLVPSSLRAHILQFHESSSYLECYDCGIRKVFKGVMVQHSYSHIQLDRPIECKRCGVWLRNEQNLRFHSRRGECVRRCDWPGCFHCGFEARSKTQIVDHLRRKHSSWPVERLHCFDCVYKSTYRRSLFVHYSSAHSAALQDTWRCYDCDKCLKGRNNFYLHQRFVHLSYGGATKPCTRCGAVVSTQSMRYHQKTAKCMAQGPRRIDQVVPRMQCFDCQEGHFFARHSFIKHQWIKHRKYGDTTVQCENCLERVRADNLAAHVKTKKCRKLGEIRGNGIVIAKIK